MNNLNHLGQKLGKNEKEIEINEIIEEILIPTLMNDRLTKIKGKSGLEFLISDKGIREQLISFLPQFWDDKQITIFTENYRYIIIIGRNFWLDYFKLNIGDRISEEDEREIKIFIKKYITPFLDSRSHSLGLDDWQRLNKWINEYIDEILNNYFIGDEEKSLKYKVR
uniref:Uncharacterized protein n=1 Tax=Meloidogyne enterolobii TaxID=390850 RepID=A0A6V7W2M0_MELEN|nr:unnamed protein product [Meloidogyne enterolobii]